MVGNLMIFKLIYIPWILGILLVSYFLFRALKRIVKGIINYRKLGKKEFMNRLKDGFDSISPTTRTRAEIRGIVISLAGLLLGLVLVPIFRIKGYWVFVELSLFGGAIITIAQLIGKVQTYRMLRKQDKIMEDLEKENDNQ
jgi:purine-cytosine permease-like protein